MSIKKAQSAIELVILVSVMLFLFASMLAVFQQDLQKKAEEKRSLEIQGLALQIQSEISIAATASNGYQRTFNIPQTIINEDYNISIVANSIYLETEDKKHAISLEIQNVTGEITKGDNIIRKTAGIVYLN